MSDVLYIEIIQAVFIGIFVFLSEKKGIQWIWIIPTTLAALTLALIVFVFTPVNPSVTSPVSPFLSRVAMLCFFMTVFPLQTVLMIRFSKYVPGDIPILKRIVIRFVLYTVSAICAAAVGVGMLFGIAAVIAVMR